MLRFIFVTTLLFYGLAQADTITIQHNGKEYLCTEVEVSNGTCWSKCPWTFDSCASSCGGGSECWSKCPWTFDSCAGSCGGGDSCWSKCPWTFDSCAKTCGAKRQANDKIINFMFTHQERLKAELNLRHQVSQ